MKEVRDITKLLDLYIEANYKIYEPIINFL